MSEVTGHTRMLPETLEALRGSIAKWEARAAGEKKSAGPASCPLCRLFNNSDTEEDDMCKGCPVYDAGHRWCENTPYEDFQVALWNERDEERLAAAQREVDFLKSLLPTDAIPDETVTGEQR